MAAMEDILSQAKDKGFVVVNSEQSSEEGWTQEVQKVYLEVDKLCTIEDPESTPYVSKYQARDLLDELLKKLEANKTIASLEHKTALIQKLSHLISSVQVRIGTISWDVEEPHNAQTELESACKYYFPNVIHEIEQLVGDKDDKFSEADAKNESKEDLLSVVENLTPPTFPELTLDVAHDALKCLNILGILWAGRGQPIKSLYYLLSAKQCYADFCVHAARGKVAGVNLSEIEDTYTHNLFYLAQAYGNLKLLHKSSEFCQETLQRQLSSGLADLKTALEWVKNCCGIADFYLALKQFRICALTLASAEKILKEKIIQKLYSEMQKQIGASAEDPLKDTNQKPNFVMGNLNAAEMEADLHRRWAILDVQVLRQASDRWKELQYAQSAGIDQLVVDQTYQNDEETAKFDEILSRKIVDNGDENFCFFSGLPVALPPLLVAREIVSFETARIVFLRSANRIELAKKYYVLDGYVTDHVTLLQEHSKLFHYLSVFESDFKRKIAMETRRTEILAPLLRSLNKLSYEALHKQISYELGEAALGLLDLKLDKLRTREGGEIDEKSIKKAEIVKCNDYARQACMYFSHFTFLYAQSKDRKEENAIPALEEQPLARLVEIFCKEPDENLISEEEIRPFLNANFLSCRVMSKVVAHPTSLPRGGSRAHFLVACLHRYEWIVKFAPRICQKHNIPISQVFGEEFQIAQDMVKLLPSKIDRVCYMGESGLSL